MKKLALSLCLLAFAAAASAEFYRVRVTRKEQNVYRDSNSGVWIITKMCLELALEEEAILKYDPYAYDNKLIFGNGQSCDVETVR